MATMTVQILKRLCFNGCWRALEETSALSSSIQRCLFHTSGVNNGNQKNSKLIQGKFVGIETDNLKPSVNKRIKLKLALQANYMGIDLSQYTHRPIPYPKTGGRGWHGSVMNKRVGGGTNQRLRMVDYTRNTDSSGRTVEEKVLQIRYDPLRSADIALVAKDNKKRWILAGENTQKGDIIKSSSEIPLLPVKAKLGDAHPLGALPIGTIVHNIEQRPTEGGIIARAAGCSGVLVKKMGDMCVVKMPSKREMCVPQECMATVGRVSNVDHNQEHIGSPNRARWFGIRPKSGLRQKKTGYHGRKIRPLKPMVTFDRQPKSLHEMFET